MKKDSPKIAIIVGSTRPRRIGRAIADWFYEQTKHQTGMRFEIIDLAEWGLPLLNEPMPPKMQMYQQDHTKRWSAKIAEMDGYVIVTPEYNHGYPAALKNALDYLYHEWSGKPVSFVSYGWGGGQLAVEQLQQVSGQLNLQSVTSRLAIFSKPEMFDEHHALIDPARALASYQEAAQQLTQALLLTLEKGEKS